MLRMTAWMALLLAGSAVSASSIVPSNMTTDGSTSVNLTIATSVGPIFTAWTTVLPLNPAALSVQNMPQFGSVFLSQPSDYLRANGNSVVLISCDTPTTNIDPWTIYNQVQTATPAAIIFYTTQGNRCLPQPNNTVTYHYSYTMMNASDSTQLLANITDPGTSWNAAVGGNPNNLTSSTNSSNSPAPGTALAMIILYAITGTITALFILIIITGTIRAHRHPERYGPRNVDGQPKRTRAGGLARAMLDTIPVVKFGDRAAHKPADTELGEITVGGVSQTANPSVPKGAAVSTATREVEMEDGIAGASSSAQQLEDTPGCSICTEDFEIGQDQRVLPCEHCFHPACIDPWLLNVSGTCPLCRVDLHPSEEADGASEPAIRPAASRRRSVLMAITGLRRPDGMTRDERLQALRQYRLREQRAADQADIGAIGGIGEHDAVQSASEPLTAQSEHANAVEDEGRTRRRLRQLFSVRTRRTPRT